MAIQDSYLFQLSKDGLQELMKAHPEVAKKIIQFLCHRLGNFKRKKTVNLNKKRNFFDKSTRIFPLSLVEKVILFRNVSIFSQTPYNILAQIAEISTEVVLKKNDLLFKKGEINTNMYIIIDGWVKIYDDNNLIAELGERQTIGELSMFFSDDRSFSIAALANTRLLSLSKDILFELMLDQHEIVEGIILVLVQRLRYLMKNQPENVL
jgi:CRP-like cAMP-binding protein